MGVFDVDYNLVNEIEDLPYEVKVIDHTWISMEDGTRLSAKLWQPQGLDQSKGAILEYLPYRKDDFTALRDEIRHKYFAGHGFTSIRVDIRGSGDSEGLMEGEYTQQEQDDALEIFDWITSQKWSNGHIGMIGKSWGGFNGLQMAAYQHPALKTIISLCSTDDRYADDVHYRGGVLMGSDMLWWASTMFAYNARPGFPQFMGDGWYDNWLDRMENTPPLVEDWVSHQTRDEFWKHGSVCEDYSKIQIPVLTMSGWEDGYTNVVDRLWENLQVPKKAVIGPWAHEFPDLAIPGPQIGYLQECVDWFSKWFVDDQSQVEHEDEYYIYLTDSVEPQTSYDYREGQWINYGEAKLKGVDVLEEMSGQVELVNHQHHGLYSGVFCPFGQEGDLPADQTIDNALATTFTFTPKEDLAIAGRAQAKLRVASSTEDANIHVRLTDLHPDGQRKLITKGQLNLNHHQSHEFPEDLEIGKFYDVEFDLDIIGYTLPADHQLEISLSPSYWPLMWPSKKIAGLRVDLDHSSLSLPVAADYERVEPDYPQAEMALPLEKEVLKEGYRTREVKHDLISNTWILDDFSDEGLRRLPHLNITYGSENSNVFSIQEDDPLSAQVICDWVVYVEDEVIDTEIHTHSVMSCDAENFYLVNELTAFSKEKQVFTKSWEKTIPRQWT